MMTNFRMVGWGVKMPIPVKSRHYDEQFYRDVKGSKPASSRGQDDSRTNLKALNDDLFG